MSIEEAAIRETLVIPGEDREQTGPVLWAKFTAARTRNEFVSAWLALQCSRIDGAKCALLAMGITPGEDLSPAASWSSDGHGTERLAEVVDQVRQNRCGVVIELEPLADGGGWYGIGYPALVDDEIAAITALEIAADDEGCLTAAMEQLQWGSSWLELFFRRKRVREENAALDRLTSSFDLLAGVLDEENFDDACMSLATSLANQFACDRVSIGFITRGHIRVQALSHSAQFGKRMNLIQAVAAAMDEAVIQRRDILHPPPAGEFLVGRAHGELAEVSGATAILTVPLFGKACYFGAVTLERRESPFTENELDRCRSLVALGGPILQEKRENGMPLWRKAAVASGRQVERLFGRGYVGRKLALGSLIAAALFLSFATGQYRLSADTVIEGAVRRMIVAPFDGYIQEGPARAGDEVRSGQLLCQLDDRDLRLERINLLGKRSQIQRQHQEALAKHDRAQAKILLAQLEQSSAQIELIETQLGRTAVTAPFAGIVIRGDLSQRLGGTVGQGEVLFELAPLDAYRVILEVDESRIADVRLGQRGVLLLTSLPEEKFPFMVEKITSVTTSEEGLNFFRVEAQLDAPDPRLRPGMEGVGKIDIDRRKLISIWTRSLSEWLRLWIWSWWP